MFTNISLRSLFTLRPHTKTDRIVDQLRGEYPFESREYVEHLVASGNIYGHEVR